MTESPSGSGGLSSGDPLGGGAPEPPRHPSGLLGYAFNWSAEGVVNEYLNDCEVLRSGHRQTVPAMTEHEKVVIGGIELEASAAHRFWHGIGDTP